MIKEAGTMVPRPWLAGTLFLPLCKAGILLESSISKMPEIEEEDHLSPGGLQYPPR